VSQEKTQRRFTAHGFKKTRAPPLLYAILKVHRTVICPPLLRARLSILRLSIFLSSFNLMTALVPSVSGMLSSCRRGFWSQEFFDAHKNNSVVEHWDADNIYVNHHASRSVSSLGACLPDQ